MLLPDAIVAIGEWVDDAFEAARDAAAAAAAHHPRPTMTNPASATTTTMPLSPYFRGGAGGTYQGGGGGGAPFGPSSFIGPAAGDASHHLPRGGGTPRPSGDSVSEPSGGSADAAAAPAISRSNRFSQDSRARGGGPTDDDDDASALVSDDAATVATAIAAADAADAVAARVVAQQACPTLDDGMGALLLGTAPPWLRRLSVSARVAAPEVCTRCTPIECVWQCGTRGGRLCIPGIRIYRLFSTTYRAKRPLLEIQPE